MRRDVVASQTMRSSVIGALAALIVLATLIALIGLAASSAEMLYAGISIILFVIPLSVGVMMPRKYDIFEPINIVALAVFFGTTLRAFYLIFFPDRSQAKFLMMFQNFSEVNENIGYVLIGVFMLSVGYIIPPSKLRFSREGFVQGYRLSVRRLRFATIIGAGLALIGISIYIRDQNISFTGAISGLSFKRTYEYVNASGETVYGAGWQYTLGQIAQYPLYLWVGAMFAGAVRVTPGRIVLCAFLTFLTVLIPFFSSNRTPILVMFVAIGVMGFYFRKIGFRSLALNLVVIVVIVALMGTIRDQNSGERLRLDYIDQTIGSGNGFDAVRAAAVIRKVPSSHDYLYGSSFAAIPVFWVPRSVWPDKPSSALGAFVKGDLFHQQYVTNSGWPPTIVGEAWINFGLLGLLGILPLIGMFLRYFYETCRPYLGRSIPVTAAYGIGVYTLGFNSIELNFGQGLVPYGIMMMQFLVFMLLARSGGTRRNPTMAGRGVPPPANWPNGMVRGAGK